MDTKHQGATGSERSRRANGVGCSVCQRPILVGVTVYLGPTGFIHVHCLDGHPVARGLRNFLRQRSRVPYCYACLAKLLGLTFGQTVKAAGVLRLTRAFHVQATTCSACRDLRTTIRAGRAR